MSTHNICFCIEMGKISTFVVKKVPCLEVCKIALKCLYYTCVVMISKHLFVCTTYELFFHVHTFIHSNLCKYFAFLIWATN